MILVGNSLEKLKILDSETVDCCVTSPPYFNLRNYNTDGQIGLESTPEQYIEKLVEVFREVKRVLKKDGTLWVVIGDSYAGSAKGDYNYPSSTSGTLQSTSRSVANRSGPRLKEFHSKTIKPRDLIGIPWMLAFALRADGWYLRQDIIWSKPNPMPESVKTRCTKSHEYIFLLSKSQKYYYDAEAISEPIAENTRRRFAQQNLDKQKGSVIEGGGYAKPMTPKPSRYGGKKYSETPDEFHRTKSGNIYEYSERRNKRSV